MGTLVCIACIPRQCCEFGLLVFVWDMAVLVTVEQMNRTWSLGREVTPPPVHARARSPHLPSQVMMAEHREERRGSTERSVEMHIKMLVVLVPWKRRFFGWVRSRDELMSTWESFLRLSKRWQG